MFANRPFHLRLLVRHGGRLLPRWLLVFTLGEPGQPLLVPYLPRRGTSRGYLELLVPRRGRHRFSWVHVGSIFPLGFFHKGLRYPVDAEVLVYPELFAAATVSPERTSTRGEGFAQRVGWGHDLHSLRAFRTGDDPRRIHWKQTARTGAMVFTEREAEEGRRLSIVFDNAVGALPTPEAAARFERLVSEAATAAVDYLGRGFEVELVTREDRLPFASGAAAAPRRARGAGAGRAAAARRRRAAPLVARRAAAAARHGTGGSGMSFGREKRLLLGLLALLAPLPLPFNEVLEWPLLLLYGVAVGALPAPRLARSGHLAAGVGDEPPRPRLPAAALPRPGGALEWPAGAAGHSPRALRRRRQALRAAAGARQVARGDRRLLPLPRRHGHQRAPQHHALPGGLPRPFDAGARALRLLLGAGALRLPPRGAGAGADARLRRRRHGGGDPARRAAVRAAAAHPHALHPGARRRYRNDGRRRPASPTSSPSTASAARAPAARCCCACASRRRSGRGSEIRLKADTYDLYDGRTWRANGNTQPVVPEPGGTFRLGPGRPTQNAEIWLLPWSSPSLPHAGAGSRAAAARAVAGARPRRRGGALPRAGGDAALRRGDGRRSGAREPAAARARRRRGVEPRPPRGDAAHRRAGGADDGRRQRVRARAAVGASPVDELRIHHGLRGALGAAGARGLPVPHPARALRVLRHGNGGDAAQPGHRRRASSPASWAARRTPSRVTTWCGRATRTRGWRRGSRTAAGRSSTPRRRRDGRERWSGTCRCC